MKVRHLSYQDMTFNAFDTSEGFYSSVFSEIFYTKDRYFRTDFGSQFRKSKICFSFPCLSIQSHLLNGWTNGYNGTKLGSAQNSRISPRSCRRLAKNSCTRVSSDEVIRILCLRLIKVMMHRLLIFPAIIFQVGHQLSFHRSYGLMRCYIFHHHRRSSLIIDCILRFQINKCVRNLGPNLVLELSP